MKDMTPPPSAPGEGDYNAARRYDEAAQEFAKSGKVDEAARKAEPASPAENAELLDAEREGLSHSKGEDRAAGDADKQGKP